MRFFALCLVLVFLSGCRSKPNPLTGEPMAAQGPVDVAINAANDSAGLVNDGYVVGVEGLEYIGDKTEDVFEFLGDIYESL